MPRPTPMGIRHEVFALAREGIIVKAIYDLTLNKLQQNLF